jgi:hypothetical protein
LQAEGREIGAFAEIFEQFAIADASTFAEKCTGGGKGPANSLGLAAVAAREEGSQSRDCWACGSDGHLFWNCSNKRAVKKFKKKYADKPPQSKDSKTEAIVRATYHKQLERKNAVRLDAESPEEGNCDSDTEKTVRFKAMAAAKKAASLAASKVFAAAAHDLKDRKRMQAAASRRGEQLQDSDSSDVGDVF